MGLCPVGLLGEETQPCRSLWLRPSQVVIRQGAPRILGFSLDLILFLFTRCILRKMAPKHKCPSMMNPADWPHLEGLQEELGVRRSEHRPSNGSFHSPCYSTATASSCCFQEELEGKSMVAMFPSSSLESFLKDKETSGP